MKILFNIKVDFSHFKVFRCRFFFFVPKPFRNKFDNALPDIFLGYHPYSPAHKILNLSTNKIILSQSVEPGNSKITSTIPKNFSKFISNSEIRWRDISIINKLKNSLHCYKLPVYNFHQNLNDNILNKNNINNNNNYNHNELHKNSTENNNTNLNNNLNTLTSNNNNNNNKITSINSTIHHKDNIFNSNTSNNN